MSFNLIIAMVVSVIITMLVGANVIEAIAIGFVCGIWAGIMDIIGERNE